MEQVRRIELPSGAWKALILPLNYICNKDNINYTQKKEHCQHFYDII